MKTLLLFSLIALAGCKTIGADVQAKPTAPAAMCDATVVQDLVGKPATASSAEAQRRAGAATMRRYESGSVVTMEYRADRLNIETDAAGVIVKLSCG